MLTSNFRVHSFKVLEFKQHLVLYVDWNNVALVEWVAQFQRPYHELKASGITSGADTWYG